MTTFKQYLTENSERMDKETKKKLEAKTSISTTDMTSTAWYSSKTTYKIDAVDDGYYDKKLGIRRVVNGKQKFIPLKDIKI